jgi:YHS domain-containing protein
MMKRIAALALVAALALTAHAFAHGGKEHVMGTVKALDETHVVVQTRDGKTLSIALAKDTEYRKGDVPAAAADLKVGDRVVVDLAGKTDTPSAREVRFASTAQVAQMGHEHMGAAKEPTSAPKAKIGDTVTCPIDGMQFRVAADTPSAEYQGKVYYFCTSAEQQDFSKKSERYLGAGAGGHAH